MSSFENKITKRLADAAALKEKIQEKKTRLTRMRTELASLRQKANAKDEFETFEKKCASKEKDITALEKELENVKRDLDDDTRELARRELETEEFESRIAKEKRGRSEAVARNLDLETESNECAAKVKEAEEKLTKTTKDYQEQKSLDQAETFVRCFWISFGPKA